MSAPPAFTSDLGFGDWLRRRRGMLGWTQADLAQRLNCAIVTLRKFESEERRPSPEMAQNMAAVLQVPDLQHEAFVRFARGELTAGDQLRLDTVAEGDELLKAPHAGNFKAQLPIPPYAIIGRESLIAHVSEIITQKMARVFTLVGAPGVGKTRLALELAHRLQEGYADGAVFVELALVQDAALVPSAVAETLHLADSTSTDTTTAVIAALRNRRMFLVLDNFEHVIDAAPFVASLVAHCANLVCLVTSRERLRIRAEHALQVNALDVPSAPRATLDAVQAAPASRLFIARAREANAQLQLSDADAPAIAELCQQLDGLPLALELLAAQADLFQPNELLADLQRGLNALENGPRDLPERHRGLRAAIEWSLRLLSDKQRALFAQLAVFTKSFDVTAAQTVFGHDPKDLVALAHANLIQALGDERWRMLEPIRQYAGEMFAHTSETGLEDARLLHAIYFAEVAQDARQGLLGPDAERWTARLEADHANLLAALQYALRQQKAGLALCIGQGLYRFWQRRGLWREALGWLEAGLQLEGAAQVPLDIRVKATRAAGIMAESLSQFERAEHYLRDSLDLAKQLTDAEEQKEHIAAAYMNLGIVRTAQGRFAEALAYFDQAIPLEPEYALKFPWQSKADVLRRLGRFDEAEQLYRQAMALNKRIGDDEGYAHTLRGLGELAYLRGDADTAERYIRESESLSLKLRSQRGLSLIAAHLGDIARVRGDWGEAAAHYAEALTRINDLEDQRGVCVVLTDCARTAVLAQRFDLAARWIGMANAGFRALDVKLTPRESGVIASDLQDCEAALRPEVMLQAMSDGEQLWRERDVAQVIADLKQMADPD